MKVCPRCEVKQPLAAFSAGGGSRGGDGAGPYCRPCKAAYDRLWRQRRKSGDQSRRALAAFEEQRRTQVWGGALSGTPQVGRSL